MIEKKVLELNIRVPTHLSVKDWSYHGRSWVLPLNKDLDTFQWSDQDGSSFISNKLDMADPKEVRHPGYRSNSRNCSASNSLVEVDKSQHDYVPTCWWTWGWIQVAWENWCSIQATTVLNKLRNSIMVDQLNKILAWIPSEFHRVKIVKRKVTVFVLENGR